MSHTKAAVRSRLPVRSLSFPSHGSLRGLRCCPRSPAVPRLGSEGLSAGCQGGNHWESTMGPSGGLVWQTWFDVEKWNKRVESHRALEEVKCMRNTILGMNPSQCPAFFFLRFTLNERFYSWKGRYILKYLNRLRSWWHFPIGLSARLRPNSKTRRPARLDRCRVIPGGLKCL